MKKQYKFDAITNKPVQLIIIDDVLIHITGRDINRL